jgi:hypothetical protein
MQASITNKEAIDKLWRKGIIRWKLDSAQMQIYKKCQESHQIKVVTCSRQIGKTYTLLVIAVEKCLQTPNSVVKFCATTAKAIRRIVRRPLREVMMDCPKELLPSFNFHDGMYKFPNGSELHLESLEPGSIENMRGTPSHFTIVDEAGFVKDLDYIVASVLLPMFTTTGGTLVLSSTPPRTPGHPFAVMANKAYAKGAYIKKTIYDYFKDVENDPPHFKDRVKPKVIEAVKDAYGGEHSSKFRTEYLCEFAKNEEDSVIPEFTDELALELVKEWPRPAYYDAYTSLDLGYQDFHGALFAYYDFKEGKLVIEDEYLIAGKKTNTKGLSEVIKLKESSLWIDPVTNHKFEVFRRVADDEMLILQDLNTTYNLKFIPTKKHDKLAAINEVQIRFAARQIIINPKCTNLIMQLKSVIWAKNKQTFDRDDTGGHFDLVDSLIYLVRNVNWTKNPYPANFNYDSSKMFYSGQTQNKSAVINTLKAAFKLRKL